VTTSYVLVETFALVQSRLGMEAVRALADDVVPVLRVQWVGETEHRLGVTALVAAGRRQLSLVDCVSFVTMRDLRLDTAFAFDRDFADQGFRTLP
jgi:predicted nucleic acid-binding protein